MDPRQDKALPSKPKTPRTIMKRFRPSAICTFAFAVISFALALVVLIAGSKPEFLDDDFMVSLNTSRVGQNIIRFTPTTAQNSNPSPSQSQSSNPLDPFNPLSTDSPLNPSNPNNPLSPIISNITGSIDGGLQDGTNAIVAALIKQVGVRDFYHLFLTKICEGDATNSTDPDREAKINKCSSYNDKAAGLKKISSNINDSVTIGTTTVSVPLIGELTNSLNNVSAGVSVLRMIIFAFLIISIIGSGLVALATLPAIVFNHSRFLVYFILFFSTLSSVFQFMAAAILTATIVTIADLVNGFGNAVSVHIRKGDRVILFLWLSWGFIAAAAIYWFSVWFVEVRRWAYVRRSRTEDEIGNWRGISREVWGDLKGKRD